MSRKRLRRQMFMSQISVTLDGEADGTTVTADLVTVFCATAEVSPCRV
jgi:hypothetical protein